MSKWSDSFLKESDSLKKEREGYPAGRFSDAFRVYDVLSFLFLIAAFISLASVPFTDVTLLDATCLFVISHVVAPKEGDRFEKVFKGISEDIAHIRVNAVILAKEIKSRKNESRTKYDDH